jgi:hypothetical protein
MREDRRVGQALACQIDQQVAALVETAEPPTEPAPGWEQRAMEAMEAVRPGRRQWGRRALLVTGAVVVVCLLIGGVAVRPALTARDILDRALEAVDQASTMHIVGQASTTATFSFEQWAARDGLVREEKREGDELVSLHLFDAGWETQYARGGAGTSSGQGSGSAFVDYTPADMFVLTLEESRIWSLFHGLEELGGYTGFVVIEGPRVDIVRAEGTAALPLGEGTGICGAVYNEGDHIRAQAEMERSTGRLLRASVWRRDGRWQLLYEETYAWDEELPEGVRVFDPPAGTLVTRYTWWADRYGQRLATGRTPDWEVTVHALDLNRHGDIVLSMSRKVTPESKMPMTYNTGIPPEVEGTDDAGGIYEGAGGAGGCGERPGFGYEGLALKRTGGGPRPTRATFRIRPYPDGATADQMVTLTVPLPPRQDVEEPFDGAVEETQY